MLHPTKVPDCSFELECLLNFQGRLLEFACTHQEYLEEELVSEFGQEVVDWMKQNKVRQRLLDHLKKHIEARDVEKKQIFDAFIHDVAFHSSSDDPTFSFNLNVSEKSPEHLVNAKKLLVGFYEQLKDSGFHPDICGHGSDGFRDRHWWSGYESANPGRNTCAVCDASLAAGGRTIEHFFPKNQYPALSTHPLNLLPLCKTCNNDVKKEKDPLAKNQISIIYLPYHRYVRPDTRLKFSDDGQGGYLVKIEPANKDQESNKRVENFEELFDVSNRWSRALGEVSVTALSRVTQYIEAMRDAGKPVNAQTIQTYIDAACQKMERGWGKIHYEYLVTEWLRWAKDKPALVRQLNQI